MSIDSNWLSSMPNAVEIRRKSKKMLISRSHGEMIDDLLEVKSLDEALRVIKDDYNGIISGAESLINDVPDEEYEKLKGGSIEIYKGQGGNNPFQIYLYFKINVPGEDSQTDIITYSLYNFKESNGTISNNIDDIIKSKKFKIE
jgi:hypothetical protein